MLRNIFAKKFKNLKTQIAIHPGKPDTATIQGL